MDIRIAKKLNNFVRLKKAKKENPDPSYRLKESLKTTIFRGKSKLEQVPCEQFLPQIEISRTFLRAK